MAVSPGNLLAMGGAGRIEKAWLRKKHEWALRVAAFAHLPFSESDFLETPADVNSSGAPARLGRPWNRPIQRVVDLEYSRTVFESAQPLCMSRRQAVASYAQQLARRNIQQHNAGLRQFI